MMWVNILLLNVLWFASVLGATHGVLWPAGLVLLGLLAYNYFVVGFTAVDYKIMALSLVAGLITDGIMMNQGWVVYAAQLDSITWVPPVWIMMLWLGFGASIRLGMQTLLSYPKLGGLVMMIGAPMSYVTAGKFNAVELSDFWIAFGFIGVSWLLYFMLVVNLTHKKEPEHAVA